MEKRILLKEQKNEIFTQIQKIGLNPLNFDWVEIRNRSGDAISKLEYKNSDFFFLFDSYLGQRENHCYICKFSPSYNNTYTDINYPESWEEQRQILIRWLYALKREIETPDLWETIAQEKQLFEASMLDDNTYFSSDELSKISNNLDEIKQFLIETNNCTQQQLKEITTQLNYLKNSSERLGRKDWIMSLIGILSNIIVGIALSPDISKELFKFSGKILSWIFPKPMLM